MTVRTPRRFDELFAKTFNAADAEGLLALYEPGAALVPEPGAVAAVGTETLREVFAAFVGLGGQVDMRTRDVIENGDLALLFTDWDLNGTDPEGTPIEMGGRSTVVLRKQPDGSWLAVIDEPWGTT